MVQKESQLKSEVEELKVINRAVINHPFSLITLNLTCTLCAQVYTYEVFTLCFSNLFLIVLCRFKLVLINSFFSPLNFKIFFNLFSIQSLYLYLTTHLESK